MTQKQSQEEPGLKYIEEGDIQWAAGLFEGEGSLSFRKHKDCYSLKVSMTDLDVLEKLGDIWGLKIRGPYSNDKSPSTVKQKVDNGSSNTRKDYYQVATGARKKIFKIVCEIYPYLGARRREKCDEFLQWYAAKEGMRYD